MNRRITIEDLRSELARLSIASKNIERAIRELENQDQQQQQRRQDEIQDKVPQSLRNGAKDRDGTPIRIGDRVRFLTKGAYSSTEGIVNRFSRNFVRVFALDSDGFEIPRAPKNVRVIPGN